MLSFPDIANWLDEQKGISNAALDEVIRNPGQLGFISYVAAYSLKGSMVVGSGFWDLLRLGEGVKSGTFWGYAQDGLRVVSLIPAIRAARGLIAPTVVEGKLAARALLPGIYNDAKVVSKVIQLGAGPDSCTVVAASRALLMFGRRSFLSARQIANILDVSSFVSFEQLAPLFARLGIATRFAQVTPQLGSAKNVAQLLQSVLKPGESALVQISFPKQGGALLQTVDEMMQLGASSVHGHAVLAYFENGALKIVDTMGQTAREFSGFGPEWRKFIMEAYGNRLVPDIERAFIQSVLAIQHVKPLSAAQIIASAQPGELAQPISALLSGIGLELRAANIYSKANATAVIKSLLER
jgi:hypothetical protein